MLRGHGHEKSREEDEASAEEEGRRSEEEARCEEGGAKEALEESRSEEVQFLSPTLSPLRSEREQWTSASAA